MFYRSLCSAFGAASVLAVLSLQPALSQEYTIRLAHELPLESPVHLALEAYAEDVEAATDGRVAIEISGGGVLGGDRVLSEQVRLGAIQMANLGVATQAGLDPQFSIEEMPYAWDSLEHITEAYKGDLGEVLGAKMEAMGATPLSFHPFGFRHLTNNVRAVRTAADVEGLKLRMAEVPIRIDTFTLLGAQPVPIAFPELFTALQQGTVDGQENPLAIIHSAQFYEVQKHISLTRHVGNVNWLLVNTAYFDSLPEDIQAALREAADGIADRVRTAIEEGEQRILEDLRAEGMEIVEDVDIASFREAIQPIYEKYSTQFEPAVWEAFEKYTQ